MSYPSGTALWRSLFGKQLCILIALELEIEVLALRVVRKRFLLRAGLLLFLL